MLHTRPSEDICKVTLKVKGIDETNVLYLHTAFI